MGLLAKLRHHGLLTVCAALALWVALPTLAAICPCVPAAGADTARSAPAGAAEDSGCCRGCCIPAAMARPVKTAASPLAAECPLRGVDFSPGAIVPGTADVAAWLPLAVSGSDFIASPDFLPGLWIPHVGKPDTGPPGPTLPLALARLVAARCHPVHAPPVA